MDIVVALDGSLIRNLTFSPGDELTITLTVYEHDGDADSITYTNPRLSIMGGALLPVGTEFTVPCSVGRVPYRLVVDIESVTTTVAYGHIEPTMTSDCSCTFSCYGSGCPTLPSHVVTGPASTLAGEIAVFVGTTGLEVDGGGMTLAQLMEQTIAGAVRYDIAQSLSDVEQAQARSNIGAIASTVNALTPTGGTLAVAGTVQATAFTGPLTGNVTGNVSGNAGTATVLATARNINGASFNGSADITVTAAAGTLTGTTIAATVVNASLNSITPAGGTLGVAGNATVTNATNASLTITGTGSGDLLIGQFANGAFVGAQAASGSAGDLRFGSGGVQRVTLDSGGTWAFTGIQQNAGIMSITANSASAALHITQNGAGPDLQIDQTPTAETVVCTHTAVINLNGTDYKFPCVAA